MKRTAAPRPVRPPADLTYGGYLGLDGLLSLQKPLSKPSAHDELQFIVAHQTFELWFRLILHEIDAVFAHLAADRTLEAARLIRRIRAIVRCFFPALDVLETMVPSDFLAFRDLLKPASGFQSWQFREIEVACGLKDERYLRIFESIPAAGRALRARFEAPSLWDAVVAHLGRRGFRVNDEPAQRASVVRVYREAGHPECRALFEALIELDEDFQLYREHHVRMAERMIGHKPGTGVKTVAESLGYAGPMGTQGVGYLRSTLQKKFFPVLWSARTEM